MAARDDLLLLEGRHLLEAALTAGVEIVETLVTASFAQRHAALLSRLDSATVHEVEPALLREAADADAPQGLVATARLEETMLADLSTDGLVVFADGLQDPGNVGALARSAEAFGAGALLLAPRSAHWRSPRALRASAGALLRLPALQGVEAVEIDRALDEPLWWVLEAGGRETVETAAIPGAGTLIVGVGSEAHGPRSLAVSGILDARLQTVRIDMVPGVESLNATVAGSLALHAASRRLSARSRGDA